MRLQDILGYAALGIGVISGCYCAPMPSTTPDSQRPLSQEDTLEQRMDPVYIEIDKQTDAGVPMLYVRDTETNEIYKRLPVAVGDSDSSRWETPSGTFEIPGWFHNPIWYPPEWSSRDGPVRPGENNPLGDYMLPLLDADCPYEEGDINTWGPADTGYRAHGTNNPDSVGKKVTHGCVRMHPQEAPSLVACVVGHMTRFGIPDDPAELPGYKDTWRGQYQPFEKSLTVYIHE